MLAWMMAARHVARVYKYMGVDKSVYARACITMFICIGVCISMYKCMLTMYAYIGVCVSMCKYMHV